MKSNQQVKAQPNNINVNHIYYHFINEHYLYFYYFEKLNAFIFLYDAAGIMVRALERGKDNQLHFQENRLTRQMQKKIKQEYAYTFEKPVTFDEESEEIMIISLNRKSLKICTFKLLQNQMQMGMRYYSFNHMHFDEIQAFEKYYIGYRFFLNQVCIFRKNNMKLILRQRSQNHLETQTQCFHLLLIGRGKEALFYKRSSFKLKIIRKLKKNNQQIVDYQERYFAIQENLQLRIIDSTNMKLKQQNNLLNNGSSVWNINQLGFFLISCESDDNQKSNSIQLQKDTLVQTIMVDKNLSFIKYSKSLGLLVFYDQE